ncbi:hypothetical protein ABT072_41150 [Streptomyces sp. NPDC002589]|uniref:hypothetical protein n=1 Tax=Streptomyces sp. NPDC002589 TaxID=3154420 RepID=UPI003333276D
MADRAAAPPSVPVGGYEADPALSVPDPVAATARRLGVAMDAAALHLPLRALARPPDRDVRRRNGWTAARHKAAQAELAAVGAVETGRRARADRTVFIRDTGETMKAPHLPLDSRKSATHPASPTGTGGVHGPFVPLPLPLPLPLPGAAAAAAAGAAARAVRAGRGRVHGLFARAAED